MDNANNYINEVMTNAVTDNLFEVKNEPKFKCPECGVELSKVTSYSCQRDTCPTFPKVLL